MHDGDTMMMISTHISRSARRLSALTVTLALAACATLPEGEPCTEYLRAFQEISDAMQPDRLDVEWTAYSSSMISIGISVQAGDRRRLAAAEERREGNRRRLMDYLANFRDGWLSIAELEPSEETADAHLQLLKVASSAVDLADGIESIVRLHDRLIAATKYDLYTAEEWQGLIDESQSLTDNLNFGAKSMIDNIDDVDIAEARYQCRLRRYRSVPAK